MSISMRLAEKISIVTGAASGIGLAVSEKFVREGSKVMMVDSNLSALEQACDTICQKRNDKVCHYAQGDVSQQTFATEVMASTTKYFGKPATVLVNSAGIVKDRDLLDLTENQFKQVVDVNLNGTFFFLQAFLQNLRQTTSDSKNLASSIVNISSLAGKAGMHRNANYAASKSAVIGLTKTVCLEMGRWGVRCNVVLPGFIETPIIADILGGRYLEQYIQMNPMKRLGSPEDVANACLFLASDESSYINGASLEVSGGAGA